MEKVVFDYLRLLDIDPTGSFLRLINFSHEKSLDLKNITIQQVNDNDQVLNSYTFHPQTRSLLRHDEIVTIYSNNYRQMKFDNEPYMFIAQDISRWSINDDIQTKLSFKNIIFHSQNLSRANPNDIPFLFIQNSIDSTQIPTKTKFHSNQYGEFHFPYCLSTENVVNPHTRGIDQKLRKKSVNNFDSYPRRLTTTPKI
ncbi:hypothetical protein I4U23_026530 [Adineta vaga]|nr:hypothetical protein I4U23_026530 [Adineta vaga]